MHAASSPINSSPNVNACASPSGDGCTLYCKLIPKFEPSPSNSTNLGKSLGVDIIKISLISACINTDSG